MIFSLILLEHEFFDGTVKICKYRVFLYLKRWLLWRSVREKLVKDNKRKPKSLISRSQVSRVSQADAYFPILLSPSSLKRITAPAHYSGQILFGQYWTVVRIARLTFKECHCKHSTGIWQTSFTQSHITINHSNNVTVLI